MSSFTSNSDQGLPRLQYKKTLFGVVLLLTILFLSTEFFWRYAGFLPSITNDRDSWMFHRRQVYNNPEKKKIVIIGTSRSHAGIIPSIIEKAYPSHDVILLSLAAYTPYAFLKDLAQDPDFSGIVICEASLYRFTRGHDGKPERWVQYFHNVYMGPGLLQRDFNLRVKFWLQSHLVLFREPLILKILKEKEKKNMYHFLKSINMLYSRHLSMQFKKIPEKFLMQARERTVLQLKTAYEKQRAKVIERIKQVMQTQVRDFNRQLKQKGGGLIFLVMPVSEELYSAYNRLLPKHHYSDKITEWTGVPVIHFRDHNSLRVFEHPDNSHLDVEDAPLFTQALVDILKQKNLIPERSE